MLRLAELSRPLRVAIRLLWIVGATGYAILAAAVFFGDGLASSGAYAMLYASLFLVPAALCALRAVLVAGERLAWSLFGIGMLCFSGAQFYFYFAFSRHLDEVPFPSVSDALWLTYYVGAVVGLLLVMRSRLRNVRLSFWIDAVVGGLALAALGAALLVDPILASTGGSVAAAATNLAYPLLDVLVISVVLAVFVMTGRRAGAGWLLVGAAFAIQVVDDTFYLYQSTAGTFVNGTVMDLGWPACVLLVAVAAWYEPRVSEATQRQGWPAVALTATFALFGLGLTFYDHWHRISDVALALATLTMIAAFLRTVVTLRDMRSLADSRARHTELILNAAGEGICGLDRDGIVTFANPEAAALTGYRRRELIGRHFHDTVHHSKADGSQYPFEDCPVSACLRDGVVHRADDDLYWHRDGSSFPVAYTSTPVLDETGVAGAVVVFTDVTARKATEDLLERQRKQLIEAQSVGGVGSWDRDIAAGTVQWSDELCRIYGVAPGDQPRTLEDVRARTHPDDRERWLATLQTCLETGLPLVSERRIVRPDGSVRIIDTRGELITDERGRPLRMVGTGQDITERYELDRAKEEFTSIVSHELRTPLTSIRGSLGLLESGVLGELPEKGRRMVEIAVQNTDRLVRLINDFLDIERINSGQIDMHPGSCASNELIARAIESVAALALAAGVSVVTDAEAEPVRLWADSDRVIQTLTNLIANAVKFSPAGSRVVVSGSRREEEVLFEITDEGRGIPAENLESIFERFGQVDASDSRQRGGTGLGLAICRSIVEQHGGRIWARSTLGRGSTFSLVLPLPAHVPVPPREPSAARTPTVLVCDDDHCVVDVVRSVLEQRGYRVIAAHGGQQAIEFAVADAPDVILLDLLMPGMSGWETAAALKRHRETRHIPIVILSVLPLAETDSPEGAIVDWVQKPLDDVQLFAALEKAISSSDEPFKVLVVEDDDDLAGVLTESFRRHGIQTFRAANGADAIRISQRALPDLLVLDVGLPEVSGFEVVEWLRRHDRLNAVPIVVYTARELDASDRDRLRLGSTTRFLTKARITPADFEARVVALLGRRTSTDPREETHELEAHPAGR